MTVKKLALLGVASMATLGMSISMAGGPATCAPAADVSGVYVGADVGAVYNTELDFPSAVRTNTSTKHTPWGWTASANVGYQFNNHWAVQFGYIWNQDQKLVNTADRTTDLKFRHYNLYLALKGMLPLWDDFSAYMLIGPAYSNTKMSLGNTVTSETKGSFWSPMGALGVAWHVDEAFSVNLQYMFIMADTRSVQTTSASLNQLLGDANTQRITVGASYMFAM